MKTERSCSDASSNASTVTHVLPLGAGAYRHRLQVVAELLVAVALAQLNLEELVVGHGACEACQTLQTDECALKSILDSRRNTMSVIDDSSAVHCTVEDR